METPGLEDLAGSPRFSGELSIYQANSAKSALAAALAAGPLRELDLSAVSEFDTAGLQLLLLARRSAEQRGSRLHLVNPSPAVCEALTAAGLADAFELSADVSEESAP